MQDTSKILKNQNYVLFEEVQHSEFNTFLSKHRWKYSRLQFLYYFSLLLFLAISIFYFYYSSSQIFNRLIHFTFGVLIAFALVPLHEFIHYLTYRILGAKNAIITLYFKMGYILTRADHFIVSKDNIKWIALMPFVILSTIGLISLLFLSEPWHISVSAAIIFHLTLCRADFRILDYFINSKYELVLFDDVSKNTTYIFRKSISDDILID